MAKPIPRKLFLLVTLLALYLTGCASNPPTGPVYDPFENANRKIYAFNTAVDNAVLKPVAKGYRFILPDFVEVGVNNFFSNLDDINVIVNGLLQGKFKQAGSDTGRFLYNSTAGILGLIDFSTRAGMVKHNESFGQTLGVWGIGEGPYLMLPFLGPANGRSSTGLVVETFTTNVDPYLTDNSDALIGLTALELIALRARLLAAGQFLDNAIDPYQTLRDFWVQQHRSATWEGTREVRIGSAYDNDDFDDLDQLDELDELDELDRLDAPGGSDELDELDELDRLDALDNATKPDELDELDRLDALDNATKPDELDELDRLDALDKQSQPDELDAVD
ncbi:VacJ family lipoprotein [Granulosicoccus antarcticus]|uniref:Putative phospholipid-binding lipoprotein MlaA n=1 Tax=Granulosicoccus antarcticus IMCC3135 TaxID=1192854 RepID=A0A2Z2P191_9GAMM|nr:VacJ family lipoprotein [Granulosicoccus antarcticus]ASJ75918.1 putative phospholipid-binding lipoprotein MlaA [Granulosicoccus antarcticus IMCC3135]